MQKILVKLDNLCPLREKADCFNTQELHLLDVSAVNDFFVFNGL